ncbi:MAG: Fe-S cluster assembly protein SufD [Acidobacteriia bacterium]|nr:Fe-S cluster assembly protein SufD [Terriglobia bacterium]
MVDPSKDQTQYIEQFSSFEKERTKMDPTWIQEKRQEGITQFSKLSFPTIHDEEWRFTSLAPLTHHSFIPAKMAPPISSADALNDFSKVGRAGHYLVFLNGCFSQEYSSLANLPRGVRVQSLSESLKGSPDFIEEHLAQHPSNEVFAALNTAFIEDGAVIHLEEGVIVEDPIQLLFFSAANGRPIVSHTRCLVVADPNSQAQIVETYTGKQDSIYFMNAVTELFVKNNAVIDHYRIQQESQKAFHISTQQFQIDQSATASSHSISLGGRLVRNNVNAILNGEDAEVTLNGLSLTMNGQHVDNHTSIDHAKPHCRSFELYKSILNDRSRGVFNGRIIVRPDAQKTDSKQTNQNLLLSDQALVNTNPQLEIYADDVKCTHGATIGQLDEEAIFYLRSRGIPPETARQLLIFAFANDLTSQIQIDSIKSNVEKTLSDRLMEKH